MQWMKDTVFSVNGVHMQKNEILTSAVTLHEKSVPKGLYI
jgi:hypothetical protein